MSRRAAHAPGLAHPTAPARDPLGLVVLAVAAAVAAVHVASLWSQSARGVFATDECFHAFAAEWIGAHGRLPTVMPELYSGFYYYYHPLLHVVGAVWAAVFGLPALHVLPPFLLAALLAVALFASAGLVPAAARGWATLLLVANLSLAHYAVRLYVEGLTTLLFLAAAILFVRCTRRRDTGTAVALGIVMGLALLTKFTSWLLPLFALVAAAAYALRGDRALALRLGAAAALAIAMALPWLVRNQVVFGSAVYPALAPDLDRSLYALNRARFSTPAGTFLSGIPGVVGAPATAMAVGALAAAAIRRRWTAREGLIAFAIVGMLTVPFTPMSASRHLNPFIAVLALAAAWAIHDALLDRRWPRWGVSAVVLAFACMAVARPADVRATADLPPYLRAAFAEIGPRVEPNATILSLWTYDTFYYTRRAATWPIPWGQRVHPDAMFAERDPRRFRDELDRYAIDYLLVPRVIQPVPFNSANYPESFMNCVAALADAGALEEAWSSEQLVLLRNPRRSRTARAP